jgi:hypothetical protein
VHQVPDLVVLGGEWAEFGIGLVLLAEQKCQRRMTGERGSDEVECLRSFGGVVVAVVLAAQLGDRDAEHVCDLLQDRHPVDRPDAPLDLGHPAFRSADQPGELNLGQAEPLAVVGDVIPDEAGIIAHLRSLPGR